MSGEHAVPGLMVGSPAPDVVADLLVAASEEGSEALYDADRLLRRLVGSEVVQEGHRIWSARLREGVERPVTLMPRAGNDVFELTRRVHAGTSRGRR